MGYTIIDLIDKAIYIAEKRIAIYEKIGYSNAQIPAMKIMTSVLIKSMEKTVESYTMLKSQMKNEDAQEIDFLTYDKILFLINQFNRRLVTPTVSNTKELLEYAIDLENQILALFIDIQGRFVKKEEDTEHKGYKILSNLIKEKRKYLNDLKKLRKD